MVVLHQKKQIHQVHNPSLSALALLLVMPSSGKPNFNRRGIMKKIFIIVIFFTYSIVHAEDFKTLHNFSSGDVLSADMFNELFTYIKESREAIDYDYLIGSWACTSMHNTGIGTTTVSGLSRDSENLYDKLSSTITFSDDGDNTYSLTTSSPNPFIWDNASSYSAAFATNLNTFFLQTPNNSGGLVSTFFNLSKFSKNKFAFNLGYSDNNKVMQNIVCDRNNIPPTTPATFTASASGMTVSLAWTDNSTDETGFKVLRKDSLEGSFSTVTTTSADATSYSDTVTDAKSYWYRVSATNSNGDSVASKMVKVVVE